MGRVLSLLDGKRATGKRPALGASTRDGLALIGREASRADRDRGGQAAAAAARTAGLGRAPPGPDRRILLSGLLPAERGRRP
jgi:hypothetical protein